VGASLQPSGATAMVRSDSWFWPALLLLCCGGALCGWWHSGEVIRLQQRMEQQWLAS